MFIDYAYLLKHLYNNVFLILILMLIVHIMPNSSKHLID